MNTYENMHNNINTGSSHENAHAQNEPDIYAGKEYLDSDKASDAIARLIGSDEPFLIGRIGETEQRTLWQYEKKKIWTRDFRVATHNICENAGFFPMKIGQISRFCGLYKEVIREIDYFGAFFWDHEEFFLKEDDGLKFSFSASLLDPLKYENGWSAALSGKKVLVVSPFSESITAQYSDKRQELFPPESNILPEFELKTVKAIQSIGGMGHKGYNTWFDALEHMKKEIASVEYDIALIGCGAYGLPLGAFVKSQGRQAVCVGGCLQLLFGIMGKRWEDKEYVKKYVNKAWIHPSESERPDNYAVVEGGCYW